MPNDKAQKLKEIMNLLSDSLTRKDFEAAFAQVVEYVKKNGKQAEEDIKTLTQAVNSAISRIEATASENYAKTSEKLTGEAEKALNDVRFQCEAMMAECQAKMDEMHDGEDADEEKVIEAVLAQIPPPESPEEETPESVRDMIETLKGEERLQIEAIHNLREELDRIENYIKDGKTFLTGGHGVDTIINGTSIGVSPTLHLSGSGISSSIVGNHHVITITSGSGATAVETPTGTVNGVNDTFTVSNEPLYIIVDGVSKFATLHYTYVAGTITITDGAVPVQYIRSVFSA